MSSIGIISDTHGLLRESAVELLRGSSLIIHAGDVGNPGILDVLSELAPLVAIRGNVDREPWASRLPTTVVAETSAGLVYVLHDVNELGLDPVAAGVSGVVSGHSHKPSWKVRQGVNYVNPGSAGPRRFRLPVTLARVQPGEISWTVEFLDVLTGAVLDCS